VTPRRELLLSVVLCLLGSALVLLAVSRSWVSFQSAATAPLPAKSFHVDGSQLAPGTRALALVALAGVAAIAATRAFGRLFVGVLVLLAGLAVVGILLRALLDPDAAMGRAGPFVDFHVSSGADLGGWPYVALLGGLLISAGGLLVVVRGRSWAAMSARYDAPTAKPRGEASLWDALDRGEDPTDQTSDHGG
jgi:uncharacterized membrane protein (TIGR02234 family)